MQFTNSTRRGFAALFAMALAETIPGFVVPGFFGDGEDDIYLVAVPRDGLAIAPAALHAWLATRLPKFMVPRYIEIRDALPKTGSGKVEKYKLSGNLDIDRAWDSQRAATAT